MQELASGAQVGTYTPQQLFAGEAPIITDSAVALADVTQYQLIAVTATGVTPFVVGTHTAPQAAIAAIAGTTGKQIPYYDAGKFNHEAITWPGSLDTLAKRKNALHGTPIFVGHLI